MPSNHNNGQTNRRQFFQAGAVGAGATLLGRDVAASPAPAVAY